MTSQPTGSADQASAWSSWVALFATSGTLVCCALPAMLVALGAGAALSSLISIFPGLVWISEYKGAVFSVAGVMLLLSGVLQWRNRFAPCPIDPALRKTCLRARKISARIYFFSVALYLAGAWFAFLAPVMLAS